MRAAVYSHLKQQLQRIEAIKWIDIDTHQINEPKDNYPISYPAVLISFGNFDYSERTNGAQEAVARVSLNLWQNRYADEFTEKGRSEINTLFNLIDKVGVAVHDSYIPQISIHAFKRKSENTIVQMGTLFGYSIDFETTILYCPEEAEVTIREIDLVTQNQTLT